MNIKNLFLGSVSLILATGVIAQTKPAVKKTAPAAKPAAKPVVKQARDEVVLKTQIDSVSYAIGVDIAKNLVNQGIGNVDFNLLVRGFDDVFKKKSIALKEEESNKCIQDYMQKAKSSKADGNKEAGKKFLAENLKKS